MKKLNTAQLRIVLNMLEQKARELTNKAVIATKARRIEGAKLTRKFTIEEIEKHGLNAIKVSEGSYYIESANIELVKSVQERVSSRVKQELEKSHPIGDTEEHMVRVTFTSMKNTSFHVVKSKAKAFENIDRKLTKAILDGNAFDVADLIDSIGS